MSAAGPPQGACPPGGAARSAVRGEQTSAAGPRPWRPPLAPAITVAVLLLPIGAGFAGTLLPAFGHLPALGGNGWSLEPWARLVAYPGFATSVATTLFTGILTALLAFAIAVGTCAFVHGHPRLARVFRSRAGWLAPILATPHSAIAIGFAFLVAPSGWMARAISPWLTGWTLPPDVATVGDPWGLALVAGLLLKEVPYLILMIVGALHQIPAARYVALARSLGYSRGAAWLKTILPQIYPQIRLPVYAVIAFSLSVVDVALILGPSNPPTLSVLAVRWFTDADIQWYFPAAAAAMLQLLLVTVVIALWFGGERVAIRLGRRWIARGGRDGAAASVTRACAASACAVFAASAWAMLGMAVWSFAGQWRYPDAWPASWSPANWMRRVDDLARPAWLTLVIGVAATVLALGLVLGCLEHESQRRRRAGTGVLWVLYLPLLVPQVAFLFGAQMLLVRFDVDGTLAAVVWAHLMFVLPYLYLSLADPWRALDPRFARAAAGLGASPTRVFFTVKIPILAQPIAIACAVAFAVSVGQYVATLFAGNGRVATLTTEAVTLAAGADRRIIGVYALVQSLFPLVGYLAAAGLPALVFRTRRGMRMVA
jgi:putative thiamine transport system permease protein